MPYVPPKPKPLGRCSDAAERPLAERGVADARAAGAWLRDHIGIPDHVVLSTARRARGTWTLAAPELGYVGAAGYDVDADGPLTIDPRVYDATVETLLVVVRELPARVQTAVLVGHNPGMEDLVSVLAGSADPEASRLIANKYPTAGIAVLERDGEWSDLSPGDARLTRFAIPRG